MIEDLSDILNLSSSALSVCGSSFIIISWFIFPDEQFFIRQIIMWLSVADLLSSLTFGVASSIHLFDNNFISNSTIFCKIQAVFMHFSVLSSYIWTMCFAHYLYHLISRQSQPPYLKVLYHILGWILPFLVALTMCIILLIYWIVLLNEFDVIKLEPTSEAAWYDLECFNFNYRCWISSSKPIFQIILYYIPIIFIFCTNFVFCLLIYTKISSDVVGKGIKKRVLWYLLIFLVTSIWGILCKFIPNSEVLSYIDNFVSPLQVYFLSNYNF